jgi:hypothetical protein
VTKPSTHEPLGTFQFQTIAQRLRKFHEEKVVGEREKKEKKAKSGKLFMQLLSTGDRLEHIP